ncbi:unnamed protein product [Effrenium voratum]|nr:unnamed protein product [Effrenium voratum]
MAESMDLGRMDGSVLLFGGAYSNLQALQAMLRIREELQIPPERCIHTGDVVAYCGQPLESTELLRSSGVWCLMGNCEESVGLAKADCGCGFPEDSACNTFSLNWYSHVTEQLKDHQELRAWMAGLPRRMFFQLAGRRMAVVHGSPLDISDFVWPSSSDQDLEKRMDAIDCDGVVCGHSGIPFCRLLEGDKRGRGARLWLNAGVIGMPANDGTARSWYALLTPRGRDVEISIRPFDYDTESAVESIAAHSKLLRVYGNALQTGIWPSHDILPIEEQMHSGVALEPQQLLWASQRQRSAGWLLVAAAATAAVAAAALAYRCPWSPPNRPIDRNGADVQGCVATSNDTSEDVNFTDVNFTGNETEDDTSSTTSSTVTTSWTSSTGTTTSETSTTSTGTSSTVTSSTATSSTATSSTATSSTATSTSATTSITFTTSNTTTTETTTSSTYTLTQTTRTITLSSTTTTLTNTTTTTTETLTSTFTGSWYRVRLTILLDLIVGNAYALAEDANARLAAEQILADMVSLTDTGQATVVPAQVGSTFAQISCTFQPWRRELEAAREEARRLAQLLGSLALSSVTERMRADVGFISYAFDVTGLAFSLDVLYPNGQTEVFASLHSTSSTSSPNQEGAAGAATGITMPCALAVVFYAFGL